MYKPVFTRLLLVWIFINISLNNLVFGESENVCLVSSMTSFVDCSSNPDFNIDNLPYGVFQARDNKNHVGVAIGDNVLDLYECSHLFQGPLLKDKQHVFKESYLNSFMGLTPDAWSEARQTIQKLLSVGSSLFSDQSLLKKALVKQRDVKMKMPVQIGDYTDFFSSKQHASNTGSMFRTPENPLLPNWKHIPVGYHGRASSVVISGTPIRRPYGQTQPIEEADPAFGPCRLMDFELEMAFFVGGPPTEVGDRIDIANAQNHIFGFVLMNDWSARDIQKWEYQPLGPFTSKNLGTTISPWIVTVEALKPFMVPNVDQDPKPFPYLQHQDTFNFDIKLAIELTTEDGTTTTISKTNYKYLYWTSKQQLTHHTVTGCNVKPGDLMATGTISGETPDSYGSMLELSWRGTKPVNLANGETRKFLQDGDTVTLKGFCDNGNGQRIGFGSSVGKLLPPTPY